MAGAERLRRQSDVLTDGELPRLCREVSRQLGITREVAVAACERLRTPVLVGVFRPMILLPAVALGTWNPEQIEMVLLHELAHLSRWDNLVNMFQRVVESALFFHPAVWIVSGWVSREREHCCDGVVVLRTGRARAYAETLLALAVPDPERVPRTAVAMTRNHLVSRIRRILNPNTKGDSMRLPRGLIAVTAVLLMLPAGLTFSLAQHAVAPAEGQAKPKLEAKGLEIDPRALIARATELAEAFGDSTGAKKDGFESLLDIGASLAQHDDRAGAVKALHKAGELIKAMPDGRDRIGAKKRLAEHLGLAGEADEAIAVALGLKEDGDGDGEDEKEGGGEAKASSEALATITFYLSYSGNLAKAIEAAGGISDKEQLSFALWSIAVAQVRQGDRLAAMETVESIAIPEARIRALVGEYTDREHPGLAVECARRGDQAGATKCLERARALVATLPDVPKQDVSRASLFLAEAQLGDVAGGLRRIRAIRSTEIREIALGTMALIQAESGAWDDAYRTARSVSDPERRFYAICEFGQAQIKAGKRDAARETFRKLLAANPTSDTLSNYHLGIGQANAGDITAALATVDRMKAPDSQVIQAILIAQAESGDFAGARKIVAERIKDDDWKSMSYRGIAYLQAKAGQVKEALRWADSLDHRLHRSCALLGVAQALEELRAPKSIDGQRAR